MGWRPSQPFPVPAAIVASQYRPPSRRFESSRWLAVEVLRLSTTLSSCVILAGGLDNLFQLARILFVVAESRI